MLRTDVGGLTSRALRRYRFVEGFPMFLQESQHREVRRVRKVWRLTPLSLSSWPLSICGRQFWICIYIPGT